MVEYYGWVNISDNTYESEINDLMKIVNSLKKKIENIDDSNKIIRMKGINGNFILVIAGGANHKSSDVVEIIDFYKSIPNIAPGSYGIMYLIDDEDNSLDMFKIFKITKGKLIIEDDHYLSPCSDKIYD